MNQTPDPISLASRVIAGESISAVLGTPADRAREVTERIQMHRRMMADHKTRIRPQIEEMILAESDERVVNALTDPHAGLHRAGYFGVVESVNGRGRPYRPSRTEMWRTPQQALNATVDLASRMRSNVTRVTIREEGRS